MAKEMEVKVDKDALVIRVPIAKKPKPSGSGKNLIVFSTGGNKKTDCRINGQCVTIGLNAYYPNEDE